MNALDRFTSRRATAILAAAVYLGIALWLIWPVPEHLNSYFYGGTGDPFGALALLREMADQLQPPFVPGTINDFNAPDGLPVPWVRSLASVTGQIFLWVPAVIFGPVAAYNIFVILGFTLSGTAGFLLARRITGSSPAGFVAGLALAFYPFAVIKSHGHYEFAHSWVIVLALWRMLELAELPSKRNAVLAGLAVVFAMAWTPYFILLAGIAYATVAVATLVVAWRSGTLRTHLRAQAIPAGMVLAYLIVFRLLADAAATGQGLRDNSRQDLITYSARLYEYLLPDAGHTLFGGWTDGYLASRLHGSNGAESTLYVGIVVLALALVAIVAALLRKLDRRLRAIVATLVAMVIVAGLCSAPPTYTALGTSVPMPSDLISQITSTWRVYARLVVVVEIGLVMLAAIGLAYLLRGRSRPVAALITLVAVAAVWIDFTPHGSGYNPIGAPSIYANFKRLPKGTLAEYPLVPAAQGDYDELLVQEFHGFPILNGYESGSEKETEAVSLANPSDPATAEGLAALGVKYALIRTSPDTAALGKPSSGFRLIAEDPSGRLYRIRPPGRADGQWVLVTPTDGFWAPEFDADGKFQWLTADEGTIVLRGQCDPCRGSVEMKVTSLGPARTLTIEGGAKRVKVRVGRLRTVSVPVTFSDRRELTLSTSPGPLPVSDTLPGVADPRSVSVLVRAPRFVPASR